MSQTTWLTTLLLIFLLSVYTVKSDSHVIVRPTDSNTSICGEYAICDTLSNLISNRPHLFSVKTRFKFLQGTHKVNVQNITQLVVSMHSKEWNGSRAGDTRIMCESPFIFIFRNITLLRINNLNFSKCGHQLPTREFAGSQTEPLSQNLSAALVIVDTSVYIQNTVISQSRGYGLLGLNLRGTNRITSSHFLANNLRCSVDECIGGNAAFYFYDRTSGPFFFRPSIHKKNYLSIKHSTFQNGVNYLKENEAFDCSKLQDKPASVNANALLIVAGQSRYRVKVKILNTSFSQNTGNSLSPAVWVHDYGGVANNTFYFISCTFAKEGTVRISSIENKRCMSRSFADSSLCYSFKLKNGNTPISHVELFNCTFIDSFHTALEICAKPTYVRRQKFQLISINNCTFQNYSNEENRLEPSVVRINYFINKNHSDKYPSITITIIRSQFISNSIPALICWLDRDTYADKIGGTKYTYPEIVNLIENHFLNNFNQKNGTVLIKAPINGLIPIWKYEKSMNKNKKYVSRVLILKCIFTNNTSEQQGTLSIENVYIILRNSTFESSQGTALYALRSVVHIKGFNLFSRNNGTFGGALNLNMSRIFVTSKSYTLITNNTALYGGGVFAIANLTTLSKEKGTYNRCTMSQEKKGDTKTKIELIDNEAEIAGDSIFGGTYNECRFVCFGKSCRTSSSNFTETFTQITNKQNHNSEMVCSPSKVCVCESSIERVDQCDKTVTEIFAFPGQTFTVPLAAMGELNGIRRAVVMGTICKDRPENDSYCKKDYKNDIGYGQRMQELNQQCTNVTYTVNSQSEVSLIEVKIDYDETPDIVFEGVNLFNVEHLSENSQSRVFIKVHLSPCPVGFQFEDTNKNGEPSGCRCLEYFHNQSIDCNINNGTVTKPYNKWIFSGTGLVTSDIPPKLVNRTVVHNRCPYDYCIYRVKSINLSHPDEQCDFNRSGILCGACRTGLSVTLGTSNCKVCSNVYLLLLIPFALAGVALVVLLLKCNLTVSVGHINGIIFYANIVQVNKPLLFSNPQGTAYQIFSTFIAWLNLDLGIETCFFENMDSYSKVWLQFVFPVYLWMIIGVIIVLAHYIPLLGRLIGTNSVPVLATLFLLSYAKLLRTIIAAVSFAFIVFEDGSYFTVWRNDGNVEFFSEKHVILFLAAFLFAILYILPLTLLVLLAPCLQTRSHHRAFKWVNRLKPFLDAYQGPYSDKFRFWTGLLLIMRLLLFVVYAFNYERDHSMNFFWTVMSLGLIAVLCLVKGNVYRHKFANHLESFSLFNIVILCAVNWLTTTTVYTKWHSIKEYATYISVTVLMLMFLGIIAYQLILRVRPNIFTSQFKPAVHASSDDISNLNTSTDPPTSSMVELEECDQLKEPLLDSS